MLDFLHDIPALVEAVGLIGIYAIIFAETGLLVGFFLPGDSLLFTAGFLASQDIIGIVPLVVGCFIAAVVGDSVGYAIGKRLGGTLYRRKDSRFFRHEHLEKAKEFYAKHGPKTIVLARFIPIVRTFAPVVAGAADMNYATFLTYNLLGGLVWAVGIPLAGYYLGSLIPDVDKYLLPIVGVIVVVSVVPALKELWPALMKKKG